ncbi:phosphatase PAP2 family protein [Actinomyces bowdenii]|uniref:phosphatase PAP2 family protein n=1 Tax=Actinomyces bowdenii TaxID=131109 RepID=UPI001FD5A543|nr:phosphatase PAP2 family protein [Actinomyces bowdenii]
MVSTHHLPATWRTARARALAALAIILLGLFSWLALSTARGGGPALYDQSVTDWAVTIRTPPATAIMEGFSALGSTPGLTILTLICVPALARAGRRAQAVGLAAAMIGSSLLTVALKLLFARERPSTHTLLGDPALTLSFPSGHSFNTAVFAGALAGCALLGGAGRLGGALAVVAAVGTTAMVGASRVYLGYHWLTDVLAGWSLGAAWLCLVALAVLWLQGRRHRPGEAPEAERSAAQS